MLFLRWRKNCETFHNFLIPSFLSATGLVSFSQFPCLPFFWCYWHSGPSTVPMLALLLVLRALWAYQSSHSYSSSGATGTVGLPQFPCCSFSCAMGTLRLPLFPCSLFFKRHGSCEFFTIPLLTLFLMLQAFYYYHSAHARPL